jgi:hypothetical protein
MGDAAILLIIVVLLLASAGFVFACQRLMKQ